MFLLEPVAHLLRWQPSTGTLMVNVAIDPAEMVQNNPISREAREENT